jgi:hypothetical protein
MLSQNYVELTEFKGFLKNFKIAASSASLGIGTSGLNEQIMLVLFPI